MKAGKIIAGLGAGLKARVFKKKSPLIVGWALTYRCNRQCLYCHLWQKDSPELSTQEVCGIIDFLARRGCLVVSFTGGEPLLRDDLGRILEFAHQKGIKTKVNSNGKLVKERIRELKNLDCLNLSLEGPEDVQDMIRGKGAFRETMEAARAAFDAGIRVNFATVLNKANLHCLEFILDKAGEFGGRVAFQPISESVLGGATPHSLVPGQERYREALRALIKKKRSGHKAVGLSAAALKHLFHWPNPRRIRCASGWISCRIEPNGDVEYCSRQLCSFRPLNCVRDGPEKAFGNLKPFTCDSCWCAGRVELNHAFTVNPLTAIDQIRSLVL